MSREIKFRAWHKLANYMCYNATTDFLGRDYLEFMQYTGLKDKSAKEVYEGDIIESTHFCKFIVSYKNGAFVRSIENSNIYLLYDTSIVDGCLEDYKVIGNIFENSEIISI